MGTYREKYLALRTNFSDVPDLDESWDPQTLEEKYNVELCRLYFSDEEYSEEQLDLLETLYHDTPMWKSFTGGDLIAEQLLEPIPGMEIQEAPIFYFLPHVAPENDEAIPQLPGLVGSQIASELFAALGINPNLGAHVFGGESSNNDNANEGQQPFGLANLFSGILGAATNPGQGNPLSGFMSQLVLKMGGLSGDLQDDFNKLSFPNVIVRSCTLGLLKNLSRLYEDKDKPRNMNEEFVKKYLTLKSIISDPCYSEILFKHGLEYASKSSANIVDTSDNLTECFDALMDDLAKEVTKILEPDILKIQRFVKAYLYRPDGRRARRTFENAQLQCYINEGKIDTAKLLPNISAGLTKDILLELDSELQKSLSELSPMKKLELLVSLRK